MKIRLRGFKGIKFGPKMDMTGPDEITVDFTGREGITAMEGENGSGKTTCIESLSHFPQLISRSGALWSHCWSRESEKEFEDDCMGRHYRSLVKIDAQNHKMEGYLYIDGSETSCVNPKITEYTKKIEEIFGPSETYFRSRFSPQRSKKTSEKSIDNMTPGAFRDLLREFLGLHRYEEWSKTAKSAGDILSGKLSGVYNKVALLQGQVEARAEFREHHIAADDKLTELLEKKVVFNADLGSKREQIDDLKETINKNTLALERKKDLQGQIERLETDLAKERAAAEIEISALSAAYRNIKIGIGNADTILQDRETIEKATAELLTLRDKETILMMDIENMGRELPAYQEKVHALETEIATLQTHLKGLADDKGLRDMLTQALEIQRKHDDQAAIIYALDNDAELKTLMAALTALGKRAGERELYSANCTDFSCAAISEAVRAKEQIPGAEDKINARVAEIARLKGVAQAVIDGLTAGGQGLRQQIAEREQLILKEKTATEEEIRTTNQDLTNQKQVVLSNDELAIMKRQTLATIRVEIAKQKALADRLPEIQVAEARKSDLEKQLAEVTEQGTARKAAWEVKEKAFKSEMIEIRDKIDAIVIDFGVEVKLRDAAFEVMEIETRKLPAIEKEIQDTRDKITTLQNELAKIEQAEKELETVRGEREALTKKISHWRYLQNECGEKGLQAHEISGAAPFIVKNANDLLMSAFDIPYTMRLKTFDEEEQKECFKVLIICPDGQEVDLDLISGGQRAWCVQALWLAMSLLKQQNSGQEFDSFFADESDGALDPDNAAKYAALYPAFMKIARLRSLIFISHQPPARAVADHTLIFEAGKTRWA